MSTPEAEHYRLVELPYQADPLPRLRLVRDLGHSVLLDSAAGIERFGKSVV